MRQLTEVDYELLKRLARHRVPVRADDALKYALAVFGERTEWVHSDLSECDGDSEHRVGYLDDALCTIEELTLPFGDQLRYSDGRRIESTARITDAVYTSHIWHPDPTQEEPRAWSGDLPSGDPDLASPGTYEVKTDPFTQTIEVNVVVAQ